MNGNFLHPTTTRLFGKVKRAWCSWCYLISAPSVYFSKSRLAKIGLFHGDFGVFLTLPKELYFACAPRGIELLIKLIEERTNVVVSTIELEQKSEQNYSKSEQSKSGKAGGGSDVFQLPHICTAVIGWALFSDLDEYDVNTKTSRDSPRIRYF